MSDRAIIFSAPMIRALLAGRKTQTRRLMTPRTCTVLGSSVTAKSPAWAGLKLNRAEARSRCPITGAPRPHLGVPWVHPEDEADGMEADAIYRVDPIIKTGDRLWVKEACGRRAASFLGIEARNGVESAFYQADDEEVLDRHTFNLCPWWSGKALSPIFMPRWASRLTLLVTTVKVERLHDIGEADARAEGAMLHVPCKSAVAGTTVASDSWHYDHDLNGRLYEGRTARDAFEVLWGKTHGWKSWDANPWVAAISFDVIRANIDAYSPHPAPSPRETEEV